MFKFEVKSFLIYTKGTIYSLILWILFIVCFYTWRLCGLISFLPIFYDFKFSIVKKRFAFFPQRKMTVFDNFTTTVFSIETKIRYCFFLPQIAIKLSCCTRQCVWIERTHEKRGGLWAAHSWRGLWRQGWRKNLEASFLGAVWPECACYFTKPSEALSLMQTFPAMRNKYGNVQRVQYAD